MGVKDKPVITGMGIITSLGLNPEEVYSSLIEGKRGIKRLNDGQFRGFRHPYGAPVSEIPKTVEIPPRDARIMDKHTHMLLYSSAKAWADSEIDSAGIDPYEIGFFAGMGMVDYNIEDLLPAVKKSIDDSGSLSYERFYSGAYMEIYPLWPLSMLNNVGFCQVAIALGIRGENSVFSPNPEAGMLSIIEACNSIKEGKVRIALAGGVSEKISPCSLARAELSGICGNGMFPGEGCGIVTIETEDHAIKRGATLHAYISGYGVCKDSNSGYPLEETIASSMSMAMERSDLRAKDIGLVIMHGESGVSEKEARAVKKIFPEGVNTFSSKSSLGYLYSGAGAIDLIMGIMILKNGIIPPAQKGSEKSEFKGKGILINTMSHEGVCVSIIISKTE